MKTRWVVYIKWPVKGVPERNGLAALKHTWIIHVVFQNCKEARRGGIKRLPGSIATSFTFERERGIWEFQAQVTRHPKLDTPGTLRCLLRTREAQRGKTGGHGSHHPPNCLESMSENNTDLSK